MTVCVVCVVLCLSGQARDGAAEGEGAVPGAAVGAAGADGGHPGGATGAGGPGPGAAAHPLGAAGARAGTHAGDARETNGGSPYLTYTC